MKFKTDDPIREAMDEVMERIRKEKEDSDLLDSDIDWGSFFGLDDNATQEEIDQACEDQL
jgi:hypothetical protein